jgi:hypothetical protein
LEARKPWTFTLSFQAQGRSGLQRRFELDPLVRHSLHEVITLLWVVMLGMSHSHVKLGIVGRRR